MKDVTASAVIFNIGSLIGDISECGIKLTGYAVGSIVRKSHNEDTAENIEMTTAVVGKCVNVTLKVAATLLGKGADTILSKTIQVVKNN